MSQLARSPSCIRTSAEICSCEKLVTKQSAAASISLEKLISRAGDLSLLAIASMTFIWLMPRWMSPVLKAWRSRAKARADLPSRWFQPSAKVVGS